MGNFFYSLLIVLFLAGCGEDETAVPDFNITRPDDDDTEEPIDEEDTFLLPNIDLSKWKVTLPIPRSDGKALEILPPEIKDYATNETLIPFMYNDSTDGSLVFYTYPGASTANSSYSRTELRELMDGGVGKVNWTFAQGGYIKGTLSVPEISKDDNGNPHRTIIMQIHGRLTDEQRDLIGENDNNAPPILKIYWTDGKVRVKTKLLRDKNYTYEELLHTSAWTDDSGRTFAEEVGTGKFTLEVTAREGYMSVTLNGSETFVYNDIHIEKWGVFENYFKAGNYLASKEEGSFAFVKYYELEVSHD